MTLDFPGRLFLSCKKRWVPLGPCPINDNTQSLPFADAGGDSYIYVSHGFCLANIVEHGVETGTDTYLLHKG